ncbi:hypothetical protein SAY87_013056 [Trapa incisa]|uniref:Mediator-associated protein 2 n=2 Tax=Trapa TaxID=22665 RepID=A0AAN7K9U1_TRANT|nr:hypothetical protein SAY86_008230 [Trapa natans]KAK4763618.1 hypothetical protein SAY87_013056 [Trapa incisa]
MEGGVAADGVYKPPADFLEDQKEPLIDIELNDSTELWLIQWPNSLAPDFDGGEVTLKLHHDGKLGSFKGSSGKEYDVVSFASQAPNATVFLPSTSGPKVAGKIARRVSFVHYPDPTELGKANQTNLKLLHQKPAGTSVTKTSNMLSTPSTKKSTPSSSKYAASSHGSRPRGASLEAGEASGGKRSSEHFVPANHYSSQGSARFGSGVTSEHSRGHGSSLSAGSVRDTHQKSPNKKRKKSEE